MCCECQHWTISFIIIAQSGCTEGEVRLVVGETDREGDVQICHQGVWGYVCGYYWDYQEAKVLCQQLNYSSPREKLLQTKQFYAFNF